ncbi:MAG: HAD family hydrolase [Lachnospiraceae bacterium]|nr:HAD family hydrolase [Lachnospiraceae bacterium]
MSFKAAVFDLDGTILDTIDDLADTMNYVLERNGYPLRSRDEVQARVGNGILNLIRRALPEEVSPDRQQELLLQFKEHYGKHCADKTKPYEGIMELLQTLKEKGISLVVVSNKADFAVKELCQQYFPGIFDVTVGEREGVRKKPAPDSVQEVLHSLPCSAEEAVYIGDSEVDVQTALNVPMAGIFVTWGFRTPETLLQAGAKKLVQKPEELLQEIL